ncbi:hypothetical protein F7734_51575 [Scytonema sp. UIC 10036]|uniref:hypothetical protein n=1 Tax=Scytonema sp. UIC 10036 TaxID=2304196 RepID=UPI0012DAD39D|nr:hypothetical protein [Scytonema sp. UIC 10036]MUH00270.1 hypothetical protein [Scytonema sp. UIC 10036]
MSSKITISQLHTVDASNIQDLTNTEIDTTKGGLLATLPVLISDLGIIGQNKPVCSDNNVGNGLLQGLQLGL